MDAWERAGPVGRRVRARRRQSRPATSHTEDELYYVIEGRGWITVGEDEREVGPGSCVFVAAAVPHRFHDIAERLVILVAFGPAEGSRG